MSASIATCPSCLLRQALPAVRAVHPRFACGRCGAHLRGPADVEGARRRVIAFALAALILYPFAVWLPVMGVERLGHVHEAGILGGGLELMLGGELLLGLLVLVCSVVVPLVKLTGLLLLASTRHLVSGSQAGRLFRFIEGSGRWGMLDVLLVAMLAALVKLGDLVQIHVGIGAAVFVACVALSLCASASFDPRIVFDERAAGSAPDPTETP